MHAAHRQQQARNGAVERWVVQCRAGHVRERMPAALQPTLTSPDRPKPPSTSAATSRALAGGLKSGGGTNLREDPMKQLSRGERRFNNTEIIPTTAAADHIGRPHRRAQMLPQSQRWETC